jgi:hypothetical protein
MSSDGGREAVKKKRISFPKIWLKNQILGKRVLTKIRKPFFLTLHHNHQKVNWWEDSKQPRRFPFLFFLQLDFSPFTEFSILGRVKPTEPSDSNRGESKGPDLGI